MTHSCLIYNLDQLGQFVDDFLLKLDHFPAILPSSNQTWFAESQECLMTPNGTVDFWVAQLFLVKSPCLMVNPIVNLPVYPIILPLNPIKSVVFRGKSHHFGGLCTLSPAGSDEAEPVG